MPVFILLVLGVAGWAWWTGRLKGVTYEDAAAFVLFLLGLRLLTTGKMLPGAALMAGAMLYAAWRRGKRERTSVSANEARLLLGVSDHATLAEIREAHRRLITAHHPDRAGSADHAARINAARDALVSELNRKPPRAS